MMIYKYCTCNITFWNKLLPFKTKIVLKYMKIQSVPRSKHTASWSRKQNSWCCVGKWPLLLLRSKLNTQLLCGGRTYKFYSVEPCGRLCLKCDGTRAETRFYLSAKRTSPFKSSGGRQFSRLLAAEVCASAVVMLVMLDTPCSEVVWRVLATHSIRQFPLNFLSRASPCAITFQMDSTYSKRCSLNR